MLHYSLPKTKEVIYMNYSHLVKSQGKVLWIMSNLCKALKVSFGVEDSRQGRGEAGVMEDEAWGGWAWGSWGCPVEK